MNFKVIKIETNNAKFWADFQKANYVNLPHYYAENRLSLLENIYKYNLMRVILKDDESVINGIIFAYKNYRLRKRKLISLPHASYAGFAGSGNLNSEQIESLKSYISGTNYKSLNFKQLEELWLPHGDVVRVVKLSGTYQKYWESLPSKVRSQANKALKGMYIQSEESSKLFDFYKLLALTLKTKGTPSHAFKYWETLIKDSGGKSRLITLWQDAELLGGGIVTEARNYAELECAAFSEKGKRMQIGMVLYSKLIESAFEKDLDFLSLGRSEYNSPVDKFKAQWTQDFFNIRYYQITSNGQINIKSEIFYRKKIFLLIARAIAIAPLPKRVIYFYLPLLRRLLS